MRQTLKPQNQILRHESSPTNLQTLLHSDAVGIFFLREQLSFFRFALALYTKKKKKNQIH